MTTLTFTTFLKQLCLCRSLTPLKPLALPFPPLLLLQLWPGAGLPSLHIWRVRWLLLHAVSLQLLRLVLAESRGGGCGRARSGGG